MNSHTLLRALVAALIVVGCHGTPTPAPTPPPVDPEPPGVLLWDLRTALALVAASVACALSMSAGVGGGGVLVPIFNILLGQGIKGATGLSQAVIAASGAGALAFSLTRPHPHFPARPMIDFSLALVLTPALLLGVSGGVLANAVSPAWVVTLSILGVLSFMAHRTFKVAARLRDAERQASVMEALRWSSEDAERSSDCLPDEVPAAGDVERRWARPALPWTQIVQLLALWAAFAALQTAKSRHGRCSAPWAALYAAQVALAAAATLLFTQRAVEEEGARAAEGEEDGGEAPLLGGASPAAAALSRRRLGVAAGAAVGAGALAGLIGMGGGFIINPLLLEFGVHPQVSAATSGLMVLFSSASATVAFAADGRLDLRLAATFGAACCASAFAGVAILSRVVARRGSSSVVFLLAAVITLGVVATAVFDGRKLWVDLAAGALPGFQHFCRRRRPAGPALGAAFPLL